MSRHKPETSDSGRVSQNAPASQSSSGNVWRLLESTPGFNEGMQKASEQFANGDTVPASELHRHKRR